MPEADPSRDATTESEPDPNYGKSLLPSAPLTSTPPSRPRRRRPPEPIRPLVAASSKQLNDEQVLAMVIRLAGDQEHPVTAASEIVRTIRENSSGAAWVGFPIILAERVEELAGMPYPDYLLTPEWGERKRIMRAHAGQRCQVCNGRDKLHVHHRTYDRRGNEQPGDLTVLCESCHDLFHANGKLVKEPVE